MKSVRIVLVMAFALSIAAAAAAQDSEKAKEKAKAPRLSPAAQAMLRMETLRTALESLDLTAEQKEKLGKVREELGPKMKEAFEKMRDILDEEQRKTVQETAKKAQEAGKKGAAFFRAVESSLKLTDEQTQKMNKAGQEIAALQKQMMKGVMGVLTPEQREKIKEKMAAPAKKAAKPGKKKEEAK
jgi:Spy/CpxP family protein refolding chaperone